MRPDALGQPVMDGGDLDIAFEHAETTLDVRQHLVAADDLGGRKVGVGDQQQPAVELLGRFEGGFIDIEAEAIRVQIGPEDATARPSWSAHGISDRRAGRWIYGSADGARICRARSQRDCVLVNNRLRPVTTMPQRNNPSSTLPQDAHEHERLANVHPVQRDGAIPNQQTATAWWSSASARRDWWRRTPPRHWARRSR